MRDVLRFDVVYRDGHVLAVLDGFDRHGNPFEFELDLATLRHNLTAQEDWVRDMQSAERDLTALIAQGMDAEVAWSWVSAKMRGPLRFGTAGRRRQSAGRDDGTQDGDEMGERVDDGDG